MSEVHPKAGMTMKEKAFEVISDSGTVYTSEMLEVLPLEVLKLETDARASVYIGAFKYAALTEATQDLFVQWLSNEDVQSLRSYTHIELADEFVTHVPWFFNKLLTEYTKNFKDTQSGQEFLDELDMFRAAYFARSPASGDKEKHYDSIQHLIGTGFVTGVMHIRGIMARQDSAAIRTGLSVEETQRLIKASPHLVLLISKLKLEDEERYIEAANLGGAENNPVSIVNNIYTFSPDLFARMRALNIPKDTQIAHRPHLQCPASISFPGEPSFNLELWNWYNGALSKAGFWDMQKYD